MAQLALVAVGLGAVLADSVLAFTVIKWIGVAYLVYLAVRQWRAAGVDLATQLGTPDDKAGPWALLVRGTLVNLTNPKGLVFLLAVLPQFITPAARSAAVPDHRGPWSPGCSASPRWGCRADPPCCDGVNPGLLPRTGNTVKRIC